MKSYKYPIILSIIFLFIGCSDGSTGAPTGGLDTTTPTTSDPTLEPYYKYAWHLNPTKTALQTLGYAFDNNAHVTINEAWKLTKGDGVTVAIIDEGFDIKHEDLASNIIDYYNIDDDSKDVSSSGTGGSHGSSCAGFMVAPINNKGVVGVAPESKIVIIKQWDDSDADTIRAFEYAKAKGAKVINCSWGTGAVSPAVEAELRSLYDSGITVVFASGNRHADMDSDITYYDESEVAWVIGVGATDERNDVATYSDYGANIDLLAPGGDTWLSSGILALDDMGDVGGNEQLGDTVDNNYAFTNGTSFASPIVAGVVALMVAVNPNITPKEVREILIATADKVGGVSQYGTDGYDVDRYRAYGKVNADKAVLMALGLK